jgi:hypothetical protein
MPGRRQLEFPIRSDAAVVQRQLEFPICEPMDIIESPPTRRISMITNHQVRKLRRLDEQGIAKEAAAARAGMDAKTARKYRRLGKLPAEVKTMDRDWRTRPDAFAKVWPELEALLDVNPGLEAKTLFADLQRRFPECFADGQLRTLQRRVKQWRAECGPA